MAKKAKLKKAKKQLEKNLSKHGPWTAGLLALGGVAGSILADAKVRKKIAALVTGWIDRAATRLQPADADDFGDHEEHAGAHA